MRNQSLPCRALAISASSVARCISSVPISALVRQSSKRSIAAMISLRKFAAISFCFNTKFCKPSSEQSHKYRNGTSGLSIKRSPESELRAGCCFYSLVSAVSSNKSIRNSPYVVLRRKDAQTQCGTENGFHVSGCPNSCGPMNEWSAKFSNLLIVTTGTSLGSSFIIFNSEFSTKRNAIASHMKSHEVTGEARHD